ncbi:hypothetical protein ABE132_06005 [Peribacillus simplex]|uniref:hypothetical protein n=1 Tax=Peribacillus simplex TaxID=1478 RepID=UPI003D29FC48
MELKVKDLFVETKKVVNEYKKEAELLDQQEQELNAELEALQAEMTAIMMDMETAGVSDKIYLKIRQKEIVSKTKIIGTILEELQEEKSALTVKYAPAVKEAIGKDRKTKSQDNYDVTEIVNRHLYEMFKEVAEAGEAMQSQYRAIEHDVLDVFEDEAVKEQYPRLVEKALFKDYMYKPYYYGSLLKTELESACYGNIPKDVKAPKEKDVE